MSFPTDPVPPEPLAAPAPPLRPGDVLADRYEIRGQLGKGGVGAVFRAWDRTLEEEVALKVLGDRREVTLARKIAHPAVCRVFDVGEAEGRRFLTMEIVDGEDLRARLGRGPLGVAEALRVAADVCAGLAAAHEQGVIHRDLKPENVMLRKDGRAVVVDFGLAWPVTGEAAAVAGTPRYMSPEQRRGDPLDARSDVYACAVLVSELLGHAPPRLEAVLRRGRAERPEDRPADARAFAAELRAAARPALWPLAVAAGAVVALALATIVLVHVSGPSDERPGIYVDPFQNLTGEASFDPLGEGAADAVRASLRSWGRVRVETSPERAEWRAAGSIQRLGGRLRLSLQYRTERGAVGEPVEVDGDDAPTLLGLLRERAVDEARLLERDQRRRALARIGTREPPAATLLLKYYDLVGAAPRVEHLEPGARLLDEALASDPGFARAHLERAGLRLLAASQSGELRDLEGARADARAAGPAGDPDAEIVRCRVAQYALQFEGGARDGSIAAALRACQTALEAAPESAQARLLLALLHEERCDDDRAMDLLDRALPLDRALEGTILLHLTRLAVQNHRLSTAERLSRPLVAFADEERRLGERSLNRRSGVGPTRGAHLMRAGVLLRLGRRDEARAELQAELAAVSGGVGDQWAEAAAIRGLLALDGNGGDAGDLAARLAQLEGRFREQAAERPAFAFQVAGGYQWTDGKAALEWLDRMAAPASCDDALGRFIIYRAADDAAGARRALAACQPTEDWARSCKKWMEGQLP